MILQNINEFGEISEKYTARSQVLSNEISKNLDTFVKRFPDFKKDFEIYVIHSLGEMDGGTRTIGNKEVFIFGVDNIVKLHNGSNDTPFFHHELFHLYYAQFSTNDKKIYSSLWEEGLATFLSEELNPGSSVADLMLDIPEGLKHNCDKNLQFLFKTLSTRLNSGLDKDYESFFLLSSQNLTIPRRAGYYLGYLIAKEIRKHFSLDQMIHFSNERALKQIKFALDALTK